MLGFASMSSGLLDLKLVVLSAEVCGCATRVFCCE